MGLDDPQSAGYRSTCGLKNGVFVSGANPKIRFVGVGSDATNGRFCEWGLSKNDGRLSPTRYQLGYNMRPFKRRICECDGTQENFLVADR